MVEVLAHDLFERAVMIKWNKKTPAQKMYTHTVTFFTKQLRVIKNFKAVEGGASKKQGFASANTVAEIQTACVKQLKENQHEATKEKQELRYNLSTKFAGAIIEQQEENKSLRSILASIKNTLI